ncbi:response regulator [Flavobacterium sp.]|uniref:response regulator n=1 Tax=Flavobacterium sp. TaxID=239 RepID=UPI00403418FE
MKTEFKWSHIMLADDDDDDCTLFTEALGSLYPSLKLSVLNNGQKLMEHLHQPPDPQADIIFIDLNMPMRSGIECLQDIRSHLSLKDSVVIMLTTSNHQNDIETSYGHGANFFITKPSSFSDLCGLINKALRSVAEHGVQQPAREDFVLSA